MDAPSPSAAIVEEPDRPFWRRSWLVVGVLVLTLFIAFALWAGAATLYYVLMAWFLALAMEPAVAKLAERMRRGLATGIVMILVGLAVAGFLLIFGSVFVSQLASFVQALPEMAADALAWVNRVTGSNFTFETILETAGVTPGDIAAYFDDVAFGLLGIVVSVLSGIFGVFTLVFFVFYISAGMPRLRVWLARRMRPQHQVPFLAAWDLVRIKVGGYIAARVVLASINSFFSAIVFALVGLPYWLPLALWTGIVAQFVPNIGTYISIALPVIVGLTSGDPVIGVWVLLWGIAYQQVENLTIEPRISARAVDLHPAVSFGAALLGAQLFGLSGALLGVPVAATAMALLEIYKRRYELTPQTEQRVAALVAPRAGRQAKGAEQGSTSEGVDPPSRETESKPEPEPEPQPEAAPQAGTGPQAAAGSPPRTGS